MEALATPRHIPELDGLRAVSVVFVMLIHATYGRLSGGFLGVDIFFVISGYLITGILTREWRATGTICIRKFYMRRALRILPPLLCCVALALLIWPDNVPDAPKGVGVAAVFMVDAMALP